MSLDASQRELDSLAQLQFIFVTGKGGVGKSSVCGALALHAASKGKRVLVVCPQNAHHSESIFGVPLSDTPVYTTENLDVAGILPELSMRQYAYKVLHSKTLTDALFHPRVAGGFLTGIPGLGDWAILGKAWAWTRSGTFDLPRAEHHYDLVIVDAPASGDGTKMLGIPKVIMELSPTGRLRRDAQACQEMIQDPERSRVLLVTLPEELPVSETEENLELILRQMRLPLGPVIVNRKLPALFSTEDRTTLENLATHIGDTGGLDAQECVSAAVRAALHQNHRQLAQKHHLERIASWQHPTLEIPEIPQHLVGVPGLMALRDALLHSSSSPW